MGVHKNANSRINLIFFGAFFHPYCAKFGVPGKKIIAVSIYSSILPESAKFKFENFEIYLEFSKLFSSVTTKLFIFQIPYIVGGKAVRKYHVN